MNGGNQSLKLRYFFFIATIVLTIVATQLIVQYDLEQQTEDARLINVAGRQRMLSQRISKLILFLNYEANNKDLPSYYSLDSLKSLTAQWQQANLYLMDQNAERGRSESIKQLLEENNPRLKSITDAAQQILLNADQQTIQRAIEVLTRNEMPYLLTMEKTVATYQQEAEEKLSYLKRVELILAVVAIGILLFQFVYIFYPTMNRLDASNQQLVKLNTQLSDANHELASSEEEIRANLDQISALQRHLESSEKLHREIVTGATDMIYELDAEGRFSFVNPVTENVTGYSRPALLGMLYSEIVHEDDRERVVQFYFDQVKAGSEVSYQELRIRNCMNDTVWVGQNVRLQFDAEKKRVSRVSVVSRDITKVKEAEMQLAQERLLLRTIIDNIPINIYVKDRQSRKILANLAEVEYAGAHTEAEILNKSDWDIYPAETARISIDEDARVLAGETMLNQETVGIRRDGSKRWFLSSKIPLRDGQQSIFGLVGISIDISEAKQAREELQVAKEKAEQATRAKSQFLSTMSHEIRTPMNGIMGMTDLLIGTQPREDQLEKLKLLRFSCENLLTIVNDILDFNKIEAGKIELENITFNLPEIIRHYMTLLKVRADEKGLDLRLKADSNLPTIVWGDPVRLGQVLNNLIGNAIKFTEKGSVELSVMVIDVMYGKKYIRFSVKDTGIGIAEDKLNSVFESFTQASSDTTRKFGGTGLGLSITKSLVALMGSTMHVESKPGVGSTFHFTVSFIEASAPEKEIEQETGKSEAKLHILLVEDNRVNQLVVSGFLKQWGHEVTFANHGKEALKILESNQFDLILMDLQMPEMDGYETTQQIRNKDDAYSKSVPIIAISADVLTEVHDMIKAVGMTGYLSKPFKAEELQSILTKSQTQPRKSIPQASLKSRIHFYTEGDPEFTKEFVKNIIANLEELKTKFSESIQTKNPEPFLLAHHKSKTTLSIVSGDQLINDLHQIKEKLELRQEGFNISSEFVQRILSQIDEVIDDVRSVHE